MGAAEHLDQAVVAAAATHAALRAERVARELEHGARVVVDPAHQGVVHLVLATRLVEQRAHLGEVRRVLLVQAVEQLGGVLYDGLGARMVRIERTKWVGVEPSPYLVGELALPAAQVVAQLLGIGAPRLGRAKASQAQPHALRSRLLQQLEQQQDRLGVERRIVGPDRLDPHLVELPVAAGLRRLVAEELPPVPELHGLRLLVHPVLEVGAAHPGRVLRTQRERAAALVLEGEHLLLHDVRRLPHPAREQLGGLEDRGLDVAVARRLEQLLADCAQLRAAPAVLGQHVECAPRGLQFAAARHVSGRARRGRDCSRARRRAW